MTALQALLGRQPLALSPENPQVPLTSTTLLDWLGGIKAHSGIRVTEHGSLAMPAVWRAVTLISGVCAAMPLHAYQREDTARKPLTSGAAAELLADPHPDLTPFELWELAYGSLCLWGNAYFLKLRNQAGRLAELWWVAPSRMKPGRDPETGDKVYVLDGDTDNALTDKTVLHIPGFGYDGVCGVSPIRLHREGIALALAAERFGAQLFGRGNLAAGILTSDMRLDDTQAAEVKKRWKDGGGEGLDGAHDIRVLGSGATYQQLTIPPEDAQFLQSREFQVEEVARMFGLSGHHLAAQEKTTSWGTGIESLNLGLVQFTLAPYYLTRTEQRLTKILKPEPVYAKYSLQGLLRGDQAARAAFYTALWQMGVLSTDDIRAFEDLGPVTGGSQRWRPLNMGPLVGADPGGSNNEPAQPEKEVPAGG